MKDTLLYDQVPLLAATRCYEYNPGVINRSGEIFANALSGAASDFADAIKKREELQKTDAYNDMVMQHAYQSGQVSEEEMNKYMSASHSAKTGIAAGHAANIVADWHQQSQKQEQQLRGLQIQDMQSKANQSGPYAPDPDQVAIQRAQAAHLAAQTQLAQVQAQNAQGGDEAVITDPLKVGDKEIPGIGVNRKTGQYVYFGDSGVIRDDKTGALGTRDTRGNFKPMTSQQITGMAMDPNNPVQQTAPGQPPPQHWWNKIFGGGGSPAAGAPPPQAGVGKQLDPATAQQLLQQAGGDKEKARQLAKQLGYVF